jgi:2-amino-4-hydroxy-6-hydroxymethyldihydropteridine diphosphokinase
MRFENDQPIFIGLGSNLKDSLGNLAQAIQLLQEHFQTEVNASTVYFSEPVEVQDQPWFYNQVASFKAKDGYTPIMVLKTLKLIEQNMGRVSTYRYGPRIIDLDLLLYKNWVFESQSLTIPHPKMTERLFVLEPLLEIAPNLVHPRFNLPIWEIMTMNSSKFSHCERVSVQ